MNAKKSKSSPDPMDRWTHTPQTHPSRLPDRHICWGNKTAGSWPTSSKTSHSCQLKNSFELQDRAFSASPSFSSISIWIRGLRHHPAMHKGTHQYSPLVSFFTHWLMESHAAFGSSKSTLLTLHWNTSLFLVTKGTSILKPLFANTALAIVTMSLFFFETMSLFIFFKALPTPSWKKQQV